MAIAGRRPKPEGQAVNRMPAVHDWTVVQDVPFAGPWPALPRDMKWSPAAKRRWDVLKRMPHAALWTEGDWEAAIDYLRLYEARKGDPTAELRRRGNDLGLTAASRVGLRIRYVKPDPAERESAEEQAGSNVASIADYRDLYGEG